MRIIQVSADYFKSQHLEAATTMLEKGEVIAFPTDTAYELGVDITNEEAVQKLQNIKQRYGEGELPLVLLGSSKEMLLPYVLDWTPLAEKLSIDFWPGGLTMILKKSFKVPDYAVNKLDTVGIRVPNHPVILKILEEYGKPIAVSSANISGLSSSNTGRRVSEELDESELALLLDAGRTPETEPDTIVDISKDEPILLREGIISAEKLLMDFAIIL